MPGSEFVFRAEDGVRLLGPALAAGRRAHGGRPDRPRPRRAQRPLRPARQAPQCGRLRGLRLRPARPRARLGPRRPRPFRRRGRLGESVGDLWTFNRLIAAGATGRPDRLPRPLAGLVPRPAVRRRTFGGARRRRLFGLERQAAADRRAGPPDRPRRAAAAGRRGKSALIFKMWFGGFNKPFEPARTAFDWLSRDPAEVDAYVADPLCGFPFSTQLAIDVLDALPGLAAPGASRRSARTCRSMLFPATRTRSAPTSRA